MFGDDTRLRWSSRCAFQDVAGRTVVVCTARRTISELNGTASFMWGLLARPCCVRELAERLGEEFEVDAETALADARAFVGEMIGLGLLEAE